MENNKKYRVFLEQKGVLLTQVGYLKFENSGYKLVDKEFSDEFSSLEDAVKAVHKMASKVDWGLISQLKRRVEEITK